MNVIHKAFNKYYRNLNLPAKASIWFILCNLLQKGISTITVPIFTRLLTTEEYGTYNIYISWFNILTIITSLNLYYGVFYNAMNKLNVPQDRDEYIASMQGLTVTFTIVLTIAFLLFQDLWSNLFGLSKFVIMLMILELLVEPALQFWSVRQRFEYKYKTMVGVTLIKTMLNPALGLLLVMNAPAERATPRILSVVIAETLVAGTIMVYQFIKGKAFVRLDYWKTALKFNIPLLPHYLAGMILNQGDRIMIQKMAGESKVGIYGVAYSIGTLVQLITNAISSSMNPWIYDKLNKRDYEAIRKRCNEVLLLIAGVVMLLMFFVPEAVRLFAPNSYYEAIYVVPPVASSMFFIFLYTLFASPQLYFEENRFMAIASLAAAVLNILLNAIFINLFGYIAAGYTTLICYVLYSLGHFYFSKRICYKNIGIYIFDAKRILIMSLGVCVCAVVFSFLYQFNIIRYVFSTILIIIMLLLRDRIKNVFKSLKSDK